MELPLNRYRNLTVLLVVIVAQLLLLGYQVRSNQDVRLIRVWAVTAVTPLANLLEVVRRNTIGIVEDYFVLINVRDENRRLNEEIGKLKMENQFLKTELQTADRAEAIRVFQSRTPSRTIAARIIGNSTGGTNNRVVYVDRGTTSAVQRGMAVITPDGIVGKVTAVYPTASLVQLVTDPTFAAGVISEKNRVHGTMKGLGQSKCLVDYVQNEERVDPGERFYTSGDDRVFPKGMPVGVATIVRPGRTFKEIYVVPAGLQSGLEEVLIVLEGVHQTIPSGAQPQPTDISILPAPPAEARRPDELSGNGAATPDPNADPNAPQQPQPQRTGEDPSRAASLSTDADRIRERYKRVGAAQGHQFGANPGRPPDFNLNPDPQQPAGSGAQATPRPNGGATPGATPGTGSGTGTQQSAPPPPQVTPQAKPPQQTTPAVRPPPPGAGAQPTTERRSNP